MIIERSIDQGVGLLRNHVSITCAADLYFHYMTKKFIADESWYHSDPRLYAGVVYLQKNPPPNTGTVIIKDGKKNKNKS